MTERLDFLHELYAWCVQQKDQTVAIKVWLVWARERLAIGAVP